MPGNISSRSALVAKSLPFSSIRKHIEPRNNRCSRAATEKPMQAHAEGDGDGYSTASEEEIISQLDEDALSKLPLHLQNNMRELQAERVQRLTGEQRLAQSRPRPHSRHLDRVIEEPEPNQESGPENEQEVDMKECNTYYAEKWFKKMLAKVAAARELDVERVLEGSDEDDDSSRRRGSVAWCPIRQEWAPATYGQRQIESEPVDGKGDAGKVGGGRASRLCGIPPREETPLSEADTVITERYLLTSLHDCRVSSQEGYMSWRCAGPYYVYEARDSHDQYHQPEQSSESLSSLMLAARDRVRLKSRRVKDVFKK
ncbi:predicted protein [Aspergillus nidulans FGSC A4]|uniref:Uncharacterized protein n=1 Tax=Emericella nidulans (strain FGSC A4 / ATCC 38163 / CBS 112.46 / NRRL 194 / M139) TaxID=227321 RepID=Q5B8J7_EMENI|nr:hypothetical protein [Aspergillus nidulans FGSC A4]EAA63704.1 predicted protein [Aspergillus nidulans FGSC A4]CBF83343.1 TPA: conserved hypothetical protein [Aspergillus nidulans FGSC A4]|eukprot:XP_660737.1 predicted protein [Aspergillus nidulans FGSC A4]